MAAHCGAIREARLPGGGVGVAAVDHPGSAGKLAFTRQQHRRGSKVRLGIDPTDGGAFGKRKERYVMTFGLLYPGTRAANAHAGDG